MNEVDEQTAEKQAAEQQQPDDAETPQSIDENVAPETEQAALPVTVPDEDERLALLEAIVYVAEDPVGADQIAEALGFPVDTVRGDLERLVESYKPERRGLEVRQVAGGFKMFTKAQHHDAVRKFVKLLQPKLKLSPPALETLAVVAYKQPITLPEIQAIRGVNASGVVHTLLKHKLISTAGRKKVVGKPMMYKTTREFLVQFGLNDLTELPNLKELEELSRAALGEEDEERTSEASQEPETDQTPETDQESETDQEPDTDQEPETDQESETTTDQEPEADQAPEPDEGPEAAESGEEAGKEE